jgi:dCMP deaminase
LIRLSIHDYFLVMAQAAARRATCPRLAVGAVVTERGHVVATGYNGSASGEAHCTDVGCLIHEGHCLRTFHAEANALRRAHGRGDTIYCTHLPCYLCTKEIVAAGIHRVYYLDPYKPDPRRALYLDSMHPAQLQLIQHDAPTLSIAWIVP